MNFDKILTKRLKTGRRAIIKPELIGICAGVRQHGYGFSSPDQLCPAHRKTQPTAASESRRSAIRFAIPAFHRLNSEAVTNSATTALPGDFAGRAKGRKGSVRICSSMGKDQPKLFRCSVIARAL